MELTEKQKNALAWLDQRADTIVSASDVMDVVGVLAGIKPAALIDADWKRRRALRRLGFKLLRVRRGRYVVSFDRDRLRVVRDTMRLMYGKPGDDHEGEYRIGAALGYPKTATEYFLYRTDIWNKEGEFPPVVDTNAFKAIVHTNFVQLILSPEHYKEELEAYVLPLHDAVREYAPHAYQVITSEEE